MQPCRVSDIRYLAHETLTVDRSKIAEPDITEPWLQILFEDILSVAFVSARS